MKKRIIIQTSVSKTEIKAAWKTHCRVYHDCQVSLLSDLVEFESKLGLQDQSFPAANQCIQIVYLDNRPSAFCITHLYPAGTFTNIDTSRICLFSAIDFIDNLSVFNALMASAFRWVDRNGMDALLAPWSHDISVPRGIVSPDHADSDVIYGMPQSRHYYSKFLDNYGFDSINRLLQFGHPIEERRDYKHVKRLADYVRNRQSDISVRKLDMNDIESEC